MSKKKNTKIEEEVLLRENHLIIVKPKVIGTFFVILLLIVSLLIALVIFIGGKEAGENGNSTSLNTTVPPHTGAKKGRRHPSFQDDAYLKDLMNRNKKNDKLKNQANQRPQATAPTPPPRNDISFEGDQHLKDLMNRVGKGKTNNATNRASGVNDQGKLQRAGEKHEIKDDPEQVLPLKFPKKGFPDDCKIEIKNSITKLQIPKIAAGSPPSPPTTPKIAANSPPSPPTTPKAVTGSPPSPPTTPKAFTGSPPSPPTTPKAFTGSPPSPPQQSSSSDSLNDDLICPCSKRFWSWQRIAYAGHRKSCGSNTGLQQVNYGAEYRRLTKTWATTENEFNRILFKVNYGVATSSADKSSKNSGYFAVTRVDGKQNLNGTPLLKGYLYANPGVNSRIQNTPFDLTMEHMQSLFAFQRIRVGRYDITSFEVLNFSDDNELNTSDDSQRGSYC